MQVPLIEGSGGLALRCSQELKTTIVYRSKV